MSGRFPPTEDEFAFGVEAPTRKENVELPLRLVGLDLPRDGRLPNEASGGPPTGPRGTAEAVSATAEAPTLPAHGPPQSARRWRRDLGAVSALRWPLRLSDDDHG